MLVVINGTKTGLVLFEYLRALKRDAGAFASHQLVMAGKPFSEEVNRAAFASNIQDDVKQLINPDNETLRALYSAADALLFPSLAEGFGWPIIEAQACGGLVITSSRGSNESDRGCRGNIY